eukprot:g19774.t1
MAQPGGGAQAGNIGAAALMQQLGQELNRDEDNLRAIWSQIDGLTGNNHPSMAEFKKAHAIVKSKEMWVLGREYVTEPEKVRVEPTHLYCALGCTVNAVGNGPLLTRQQRDDAIAKYMSAQNALSKPDAVQCVGECKDGKRQSQSEQVCHQYLQMKCTRKNCRFGHPADEAAFPKSNFDQICVSFPFLKPIQYGSWWKKEEKKEDE